MAKKKPVAEAQGIPPQLLAFRWDLNAECNYEEISGRLLLNEKGEMEINLRKPKEVRELVYAGLRSNVPDLAIEDVGRLISAENALAVYKMVFRRMKLSTKPQEPPKAEAPATG
jgi:hypothetical protein